MYKKHIGLLKSTGRKVAVVYREVPDDTKYCLVVDMLSLQDRDKDDLEGALETENAQNTLELYEYLYSVTNSRNINHLNFLHQAGKLMKVPVEQIDMQLAPGLSVPLSIVNEQISNPNAHNEKRAENDKAVKEQSNLTDLARLKMKAELLREELTQLEEKIAEMSPVEKTKAVETESVKRKPRARAKKTSTVK